MHATHKYNYFVVVATITLYIKILIFISRVIFFFLIRKKNKIYNNKNTELQLNLKNYYIHTHKLSYKSFVFFTKRRLVGENVCVCIFNITSMKERERENII